MEEGDSIALVYIPGNLYINIASRIMRLIGTGIQFLTGQAFDIKAITEAAHAKVNKSVHVF